MTHESRVKRWSSLVALIYILTGMAGTWGHASAGGGDGAENAVDAAQAAMAKACDAAGQSHDACTAAHAACHSGLLGFTPPDYAGDTGLGFRRDSLHSKPPSLTQVQDHPPPKAA